jgi:hypothetical protein
MCSVSERKQPYVALLLQASDVSNALFCIKAACEGIADQPLQEGQNAQERDAVVYQLKQCADRIAASLKHYNDAIQGATNDGTQKA